MPGTIDSKRVVERFVVEVVNEGRPEAMEELVSHGELPGGVAWFKRAFPDHALKIESLLAAEDDHVAAQFVASGTHLGPLDDVPAEGHTLPPAGRRFEVPLTAIYRVDDGRISDHWLNWDWVAILDQLGFALRAEPRTSRP
jgi:ketosteroid isomerase-like protein